MSARLVPDTEPGEAEVVRLVFERFIELKSTIKVARELDAKGLRTKARTTKAGKPKGNRRWNKMYVSGRITARQRVDGVPKDLWPPRKSLTTRRD